MADALTPAKLPIPEVTMGADDALFQKDENWFIRFGGGDKNHNGKPDLNVSVGLKFPGLFTKTAQSGPIDLPTDMLLDAGERLIDGMVWLLPLPPELKTLLAGAHGFVSAVSRSRLKGLFGIADKLREMMANADKPAGF